VVGSNMDKIYIVMDYIEHDLKALMETMKESFSIGQSLICSLSRPRPAVVSRSISLHSLCEMQAELARNHFKIYVA